MAAQEFYEKNKTNVVNVPRPGYPEDKSGWDGVRSASEAQFVAKNVLVMPLWDVFDFAEKYLAAQSTCHETPPPCNHFKKCGPMGVVLGKSGVGSWRILLCERCHAYKMWVDGEQQESEVEWKLPEQARETPAAPPPLPFPTKDDCRIVEAIGKAAKQIHAEFDCLSDHVQTKKQIREQISTIIWRHLDKARLAAASPEPPQSNTAAPKESER